MNSVFKNFLKFFKKRKIRIVYTLGGIPEKRKEYDIFGKKVLGCEAYDVLFDKVLTYSVKSNIVKVFVPLFFRYVPFLVLPLGRIAPAWDCKGRGQVLDYLYWIPPNYEEKFNRN